MDLVDGLEGKKHLAPQESVSRTSMLFQLPGEYCDPFKEVTNNSNNNNNNNYNHGLNVIQIYRIKVTVVQKFGFLLNVLLVIILVINQFNAQNCFIISSLTSVHDSSTMCSISGGRNSSMKHLVSSHL